MYFKAQNDKKYGLYKLINVYNFQAGFLNRFTNMTILT